MRCCRNDHYAITSVDTIPSEASKHINKDLIVVIYLNNVIAPCDHVVQIYDDDEVFVDMLAGFTGDGINTGDCVVIIATTAHLIALEKKLESFGVQVDVLISDNRYIPLNAEKCLAKFMVNGWPDEKLFTEFICQLLEQARGDNRRVRAF